ncbi:MAG: putative Ig domain-containing protein, partial [Synergistaceae bacterium]|nr:putative Ig domain-containing protein [Synergistaceae bacterium]
NLPEGLTLNGDTISGTPTGAAKSYKVKLTATNPVKSAKKTVILKVIAASDTRLPAMSESVGDSYSFVEHSVLPELTFTNSDGYIIVAVLPEISVDVSGMYEFDVALSDDVPEGAELVYLANSDSPSDDDEISEFFDAEGEPITTVPEDRRITLSIWLNPHTVCNPAIAIKQ